VDAEVTVDDVSELHPIDFRWPEGTEHFERGWDYTATIGSNSFRVRHGIGGREVYGRYPVHSVTGRSHATWWVTFPNPIRVERVAASGQAGSAEEGQGDEPGAIVKYAVIYESAANNYAAYVPDLPGCVATGRTRAEVKLEIQAAIRMQIEGSARPASRFRSPGRRRI
jgi:predicted RNase H-like HicB family nuclease